MNSIEFTMIRTLFSLLCLLCMSHFGISQSKLENKNSDSLQFSFNDNVKTENYEFKGQDYSFVKGLDGNALSIKAGKRYNSLKLDNIFLDGKTSFTVQFWVKTKSEKPTVLLSQKEFRDKSIGSQKKAGWVLYSSEGTFAWSIGSGKRRLTYERDNGELMPLNDGDWHQLTMTYDVDLSEAKLYYDGQNKAVYKVGFDFSNDNSLVIGSQESNFDFETSILSDIKKGAKLLQNLVDEFNVLDVENVNESEFLSLIVDPKQLYFEKLKLKNVDVTNNEEKVSILVDLLNVYKKLSSNTYTIHQNKNLTRLKPVSKLYSLINGRVTISDYYAKYFTEKVRLYPSDFSMDKLELWKRVISEDEILSGFTKHREAKNNLLKNNIDSLTVASWNIWHGGKHFTQLNDDWDSLDRIVEMIKKSNVDIILMQETYSSGDFIAAELGYYFATTSDWDYCSQGSNISVISRYPIKEIEIHPKTEFMNVAVKLTLSKTQEIYAMSNWYGMNSFPVVYDFHEKRFNSADVIPILMGGDFNAIPNSDGGNNPASLKLLENGFKDAFRSLHPNVDVFPGYTHEWGERIDQLYYKGKGLKNTSTKVIHSWFGGFPSDHNMILSKFKLEY